MSCLVTRPLTPEPDTCEMSTLCSVAILRTSGDDRWRRSSSRDTVGARHVGGASVPAVGWLPSGAGLAAWAGAGRASAWRCGRDDRRRSPAAPHPRRPAQSPRRRCRPARSRLPSLRWPAACRRRATGISASTLSVEISNSGSSRSTCSPTFLIQRTTVPSATDSPIWGITTLTGIRVILVRLQASAPARASTIARTSGTDLWQADAPVTRAPCTVSIQPVSGPRQPPCPRVGRNADSSGGLYGTGVSSDAMRMIGASRYSNASSAMSAAISPPMPPVRGASYRHRARGWSWRPTSESRRDRAARASAGPALRRSPPASASRSRRRAPCAPSRRT